MYADLEKIVTFTFASSSGKGGQNVNRRATKAILQVSIDALELPEAVNRRFVRLAGNRISSEGKLTIVSQEARTQDRNRRNCLYKLRELILRASQIPTPRVPTNPTPNSQVRRLDDKRKHSLKKKMRRPDIKE